jgi:hypothetical protein
VKTESIEQRRERNELASHIHTNCCDAWWTGLTASHCSACHQTFTSPSAFAAHRPSKANSACQPPREVGLVPAKRKWTGWSYPERDKGDGDE